MTRHLFALLLSTALLGWSHPTLADAFARPVEALHRAFVQNIATDGGNCDKRSERMGTVVDAQFDLPSIARRTLRRNWDQLNPQQQARFVASLRKSVVATYAKAFAPGGELRFETLSQSPGEAHSALVKTRLLPKQGAAVLLDYTVASTDDGPRIQNVTAEGVSDLALRAAQYHKLLKNQGFDALIIQLDQQTTALLSHCS